VLVAREWPVRVLAAALAEAGLFLGNDSGVSHLAAAVGTPTVALFGPTDPTVWSPIGPRVTVVRSPDGTMDAIGLDAVVAAADERRGDA
jgi:ADP-heptose:LPS heptosyltransferase